MVTVTRAPGNVSARVAVFVHARAAMALPSLVSSRVHPTGPVMGTEVLFAVLST